MDSTFKVLSSALKPCRTRPKRKRYYTILRCPYCDGSVDVPTDSFESWVGRAVTAHLQHCAGFHWDIPTLRRARRRERCKPCGREQRARVQLHLGAGGQLERHPLASLLRCVAPTRRALDATK